ncbi:MAG: DUF763 domain-containing protein [Spirochaetales bacterium]|uniref:DUF763 domain-containing protein n=1 Tax=Treponema berlinense TaxID=225004 RepID=A0A1T4K890_9SPIR|nr:MULTISPECIES: DUF763 domain-containing protein [Treponema]MDO5767475.1 DUF763 domain-containing protein [Spirochaetales bacterium]MBQ9103346.1 DUF763 domain-containing protein [Treponema sp.]MCI5541915.1 DUF763 domain-containing protein [Treponema berlinense]MDD5835154.1 DUF763 domain-containing protein [Treponema berlinense]MDY3707077.1 DUF763 domain-containing protein [Treponema berlinense]
MIKRSGYADLPLHTGTVPKWLADRMMRLGTLIIEALVLKYGKKEVLIRLSDPLWFQSLGAVLGMDWHSSGITTSVMYALKRGLNRRAKELGIVVCGGRGKYSRRTPEELQILADMTGMDGNKLINCSKLAAKVDGTALQDGFQLYQHNFILSDQGDWTVVQQGMNVSEKKARRYHWSSEKLRSFVENPHTGVTGENQGLILNLTDINASSTRSKILSLTQENPDRIIREVKKMGGSESLQLELFDDAEKNKNPPSNQNNISNEWQKTQILIKNDRNLVMPSHHEIRAEDVDLKRLGAVLATAYESENTDFESLLLTPGLGPRTLQSLTLVSEVIYGTPSRFTDPARFSFAHGGKDGHPFPVTTKIYDESIRILGESIEESKMGYSEKSECLYRLEKTARYVEENCEPEADFDALIAHEREHSKEWGGRTCHD